MYECTAQNTEARSPRSNSLEAALEEVDALVQFALGVPVRNVGVGCRDFSIGVRRILNDDRRVQAADEGVQVRVRRLIVVANVGLQDAVCSRTMHQSRAH